MAEGYSSLARLAVFCVLQPILRNSRQASDPLARSPSYSLIIRATRGIIQSSLGYPCAFAPRASRPEILTMSASENFGPGPGSPFVKSPASPCSNHEQY